jgi:hypothetical protein
MRARFDGASTSDCAPAAARRKAPVVPRETCGPRAGPRRLRAGPSRGPRRLRSSFRGPGRLPGRGPAAGRERRPGHNRRRPGAGAPTWSEATRERRPCVRRGRPARGARTRIGCRRKARPTESGPPRAPPCYPRRPEIAPTWRPRAGGDGRRPPGAWRRRPRRRFGAGQPAARARGRARRERISISTSCGRNDWIRGTSTPLVGLLNSSISISGYAYRPAATGRDCTCGENHALWRGGDVARTPGRAADGPWRPTCIPSERLPRGAPP